MVVNKKKNASCGLPLFSVEINIVDDKKPRKDKTIRFNLNYCIFICKYRILLNINMFSYISLLSLKHPSVQFHIKMI